MHSETNSPASGEQDNSYSKTKDFLTNHTNEDTAAYLSKKDFSETLEKLGLTAPTWLKIFQDELSINKSQQLQHLTEKDVQKLMRHTDKDWEKRLLRTLIKDEEDNLKHLKDVLSEAKQSFKRWTSNPEKVKESLEKVRSLLNVPDKEWQSQIQKVGLDKIISSFDFQKSKIGEGIPRTVLEDEKVITGASGGLALMGVYLTDDLKDLCEPRQTVIQLPRNINLKGPLIMQFDDTIEISSIETNSNFHRAMDVLGLNLKAYTKISNCKVGGLASRESEKEASSYSHTNSTFYSRVKYSCVPIKACELKHDMVRLVPEAVQMLSEIDKLSKLFCREVYITSECTRFFQRFGSHINIGMLHFGGIYKWIATYSGETKSSENIKKKVVSNSLNGFVTAFMPSTNIGVEVSAKYLSSNGNMSKVYSETDLSNTTVKILKCGGPQEIDDFYVWKYILSSCNSTWSLIDRGKLCGIWEIIQNHSKDFDDQIQLSYTLQKAWKKRNMSNNVDFTKDRQLVRMLVDSNGEIKNWIKKPNPTTCIRILERLVQCKSLKIEIDEGNVNWMNLLHAEETIKHFFDIIANDEAYATPQRSYVKYLVREIMHPLCDNKFSAWYHITKWSTIRKKSDLTLVKKDFKTIGDLLKFVKQNILPLFISYSIEDPMKTKSVEEEVTFLLAKACFYSFSCIEDRNDAYGSILLKLMLIKLKYDDKNYYFPTYLSEGDIKRFVDESDNDLHQYNLFTKRHSFQLQAFLILEVSKRLQELYVTENTEKYFDKYLLSIRHILDDNISKVVEEHTSSTPYEWRELQDDLAQVAEGKELLNTLFGIAGITLGSPSKIVNIKEIETPSSKFNSFLHDVGLLDYFPRKISFPDVLTKQIDHENPEYKDLPWILLKDILMCNYNGRDQTLHLHLNRINVISNNGNDDSDSIWNSPTNSMSLSRHEQSVNPSDLIMAVYMCCTPALQQTMITNMFLCKLGIPFVLPSFQLEAPLVILVWSIRQIFIERKMKDSIVKSSASSCPCLIVSFIRLGRPDVSKSKIINQLLSSSHNTFFNSDCPLGNTNRCFSDGMIEAAWHLPSTANDNVTLFLNLRGDAMRYPKQTEILLKMSQVLVVAISIADIQNDQEIRELTKFHKSGRGVVIAIDAFTPGYGLSSVQVCQGYLKSIGEFQKTTKIVVLANDGQRTSLSEVANKIKKAVSSYTSAAFKLKSLNDVVESGIYKCLSTDEEMCYVHNEVKKEIDTLKYLIFDSGQDIKSKIVPLQRSPWTSWSKIHRELSKSSAFMCNDEMKILKRKMVKQRLLQLEKLQSLHPFMMKFINILLTISSNKNDFDEVFMIRLKLIIDETSNLEEIERNYQLAILSLRSAKKNQMPSISYYEQQLIVEECERQLLTSSFGFEHLIREIGQIYEAVTEPDLQNRIYETTKNIVARFPEVCARIILKGQPFEIMDGDAKNVPERWVKNVLLQLQMILGESKVWILSVLGIQSTGKSTLLNTMFGLQFPVSAGRCTRGLFMQLVQNKDKEKGFDFILVIDTEGLRAEELVGKRHNNDNKLATFVIGFADTTIINIFGEHVIAIPDILQIVVVAFLRLRQAQRKFQLHKSCVFVHHNVSATNANQKLAYDRERFVNQLDNITKEAAENEHATDITTFNQMIKFDCHKDVWYFPSLWLGSLPMAPRNPEYSIAVEKLKRSLLNDNASAKEIFSTIHDVSIRICNLWQAVLSDDFVFNFRNCMELKAYNILESKFQHIAFKLEQFAFNFTHIEVRSVLEGCDDEDALDEKTELLLEKCQKQIIDQNKILQKELSLFIHQHPQKDKMEDWEQNKYNRLNDLERYLTNKAAAEIHTLKEETMMVIQIHDKKYEQDLIFLATELAHNFDKQPDDMELEQIFDDQWVKYMMKFSSRNPKTIRKSIAKEISARVYAIFFDITPLLDEYLGKTSRVCYENLRGLGGSIEHEDIEVRHIEFKKSLYEKNKFWRDKDRHCRNKVIEFTNILLQNIEDMLRKMREGNIGLCLQICNEIFDFIKQEVEKHNQDKSNEYLLNVSYKAMIVIHVVRYITVICEGVDKIYHIKHSPEAQLEKLKPATLMKFKGLVTEKANDVIAADIFLGSLKQLVIAHVSECLPMDIYCLIQLEFPLGKPNIIKHILSSLANQGSYKKFFEYIKTPNQFARQWLIRYVNDNILSSRENGCKSEYTRLANIRIDKIFIQFSKSLSATLHTNTISEWMTIFIEDVNSSRVLPISRNISKGVSDDCNIEHFTDSLMGRLSEIKDDICKSFEKTTDFTDEYREHPVHKLMYIQWGCEAICPFCHEPCKHSNKAHIKDKIPHSCIQHRITGTAGHYDEPSWYQLWKDNTLMMETCNDLVRSKDLYFYFDGKYRPWTQYRDFFPDWDIEPGSNNNDFWKWFVCRYKDYIEREYGIKLMDVPQNWIRISKEVAIDSLF